MGPALVAGALLACSPDVGEQKVVERFIVEDPQALLDRAGLFDRETVFDWRFGADGENAWTSEALEITRLPDRWRLRPVGKNPRLVRQVSLDAESVHALGIDLSGLGGRIVLRWAGEGEAFSRRRQLVRKLPPRRSKKRSALLFDLASHPKWRGEVERLRLDLPGARDQKIDLFSIRALRETPRAERFEAAVARPWKLGLEADVRNVYLAFPDLPIERQVEVGRGQLLSFAYGAEAALSEPLELRVVAEPEDAPAQTLFETRLDRSARGRWHERVVSLDPFAGRRVRLRLEAASERPLDPARGLAAWAHPEILAPAEDPELPNVVLISIDTLRADHLSAYGYELETSPEIDAWARDSAVLFRNVVAPAPWTIPSHASMLTGLDAYRHGVNHVGTVPASLELLPEILRRAGYVTAAFTGGGWLRPQYGFVQGFDAYRFWTGQLSEQLEPRTDQLLAWIESHRDRRFFVFFHTYEVHGPHRYREPYFQRLAAAAGVEASRPPGRLIIKPGRWHGEPRWTPGYFAVRLEDRSERRLSEEETRWVQLMYDSAIAHTDAQIGRLLRRLEALGLRGKTLIVLTSDHGEALGEDGRAGHHALAEDTVLVPLVIELPDRRGAGEQIDRQVRTVDVVPTILDALGLAPPGPLDGVSLLAVIAGDESAVPPAAWSYAAKTNYGLAVRYANRLKYILNNAAWTEVGGEEELRDLRRPASNGDPTGGDGERLERFRRLARERMLEQHQGLRMRIENRGSGPLRGRLAGTWAEISRVKSADLDCRCLSWDSDSGHAGFELEPGQEVTLLFEGAGSGSGTLEAELEGAGGRAARIEQKIDLAGLEEPLRLAYVDAGWSLGPAVEEDDFTAGFTLWRAGERRVAGPAPAIDAEAEAQLRALGYVD